MKIKPGSVSSHWKKIQFCLISSKKNWFCFILQKKISSHSDSDSEQNQIRTENSDSCSQFNCQNIALQFDIICSLILCVIWYCLHSFILFFLFNFNYASSSFHIFRLEHTLLILYFLSLYSHWEWWHFFKRGICYKYDTVTASS